ncbi:MAG: B12-binding domain-containing radical SAM protein [Desulfobacterales bacterium]|nr:MAG: B12-binding domain-containing radical SAM protein [Desulfobacterales bacterium]
MSSTSIQDILPHVQLPSRYLGNEVNTIVKSWDDVEMHVALAFPDLYEIATSHFGIQILYGLLNKQDNILAERVYAPAMDMERQLRIKKVALCSLESRTPLNRFDLVGFSLLYELNYTNMLNMLELGGIAFRTEDRGDNEPFVIAGGPCTSNPEPVADFFDAIVVGDGEIVVLEITEAWKKWRRSGKERSELLKRWQTIKGVYVPSLYNQQVSQISLKSSAPIKNNYPYIERAVVPDLNKIYFPESPIVPFGKPIHDRLRMEIARGCTRGCRFCQAGMIYRPVRERCPDSIVSTVSQSLKTTGYEDLSLLSLSTGDYACIAPTMEAIMEYGENDRIAVSLPSLRADSITPELMKLIKKVRKTGFTIAPEAGSQRMRNVINKNITEDDIIQTVENAFTLGWKVIKLYFMIGLPTETQEDVQAIVNLVGRVKEHIKKIGKNGKINVSVATFVPKPHTPFQWEPQIGLDLATKKINFIKEKLKSPGIQVKWQDPRVSVVEGIWSRGDRRLGDVLIRAWQKGCRFDGWSDHFNFERWMDIFKESGININDYSGGFRGRNDPLPWDHIHIGVDKSFLEDERKRALDEKNTEDCRTGRCSKCGVCNFKSLKPICYHEKKRIVEFEKNTDKKNELEESFKYEINFSKLNSARFLGHLEMVKIFSRALRRAKIPVKFSKGYHPMPKISFGDTLPVGMQSESEQLNMTLTENIDPSTIVTSLQPQLPENFIVIGCKPKEKSKKDKSDDKIVYKIQLKDGNLNPSQLRLFIEKNELIINKKNKKGKNVAVDLKKAVSRIKKIDERQLLITLERQNNLLIRPAIILKKVFNLSDDQLSEAVITKCKVDYV